MENEHCRQVLSTYQYTTASTPQHPEGILLESTLFSRMYGTEPDGATVVAGKTGFTNEAGNTLVSYAEGLDGHDYILVTLKGSNKWKAINDTIDLYTEFSPLSEETSATTNSTTSAKG
jgi:D-alanyl-D-alanine carboxypeptidase (penicillin-binding protein 5/6)